MFNPVTIFSQDAYKTQLLGRKSFFFSLLPISSLEGQAWCSGESCLTESPGRGFETTSPQILRGKGLSWFIPFPDPTHMGASGTGSAQLL